MQCLFVVVQGGQAPHRPPLGCLEGRQTHSEAHDRREEVLPLWKVSEGQAFWCIYGGFAF